MSGTSQRSTEPPINSVGAGKAQLLKWAKDATRSAAELSDACGRFPEVDRAIASHPSASGELLAKLSHSKDKATRARVAANAATPSADLVRLGQQFPKEFLENPALDLLMIENPALLEDLPQALLLRLLKSDRCPAEFLVWAAGHADEKVQLAVAMNTKSPPKALERLRDSQHYAVQENLKSINEAQFGSTGQDCEQIFRDAVAKRLGSLSWSKVREAWKKGDIGPAQYICLSPLGRLAVNGMSVEFAIGLAEKGVETDVLTEALARSTDSEDRILVARSSKLDIELINILSRDRSYEVREALVLNQFVPQSLTDWVIDGFQENVDFEIIRRIAKSSRATGKVLEALAQWDKSSSLECIDDVRCSVAKNPSTPASVLADIALRKDNSSKAVVLNAACPEHIIRKVLQPWIDKHFLIQEARQREGLTSVEAVPGSPLYAFALEGKVSRSWVDEITRIGESRLQAALAANKYSPADFLLQWSRSPQFDIRLAVAGNESSPIEAVSYLALAPEKEIRNAVARNPRTPVAILETLSKDKTLESRSLIPDIYTNWRMDWCQSVGLNKAASELALNNIAATCDFNSDRYRDLHSLCTLGGHSSAGHSLIERLTKHQSKDIRYIVHKNPALPIDIMLHAVSSTDRWARLGVARNPSASIDVLIHLASDRDKWIRTAVALHPVTPLEIAAEVAGAFMSDDWKRSSRVNKLVAKATDAIKDACETGNILLSAMRDQDAAARSRRPVASLMAVCSGPYIQPVQMVRMSRSTDWLIRAATARNRATPTNLLALLSQDFHPLVRNLANRTQHTLSAAKVGSDHIDLERVASEILTRLKRDGKVLEVNSSFWNSFATAAEVLEHRALPLSDTPVLDLMGMILREKMNASQWSRLQKSTETVVSQRQHLRKDLFWLLKRLREYAENLVKTGSASSGLGELSTSDERYAAAGGCNTPIEMQTLLVEDENVSVRLGLANNSNTDAGLLAKLVHDKDSEVRNSALKNPNISSEILETRFKSSLESDDGISDLASIVMNPSTSDDLRSRIRSEIQKVFNDVLVQRVGCNWLRIWDAMSLSTSPEELEELSLDEATSVRLEVGRNPYTPPSALMRLSNENIPDLRKRVGGNPSTPVDILEKLATDSNVWVRESVAKNPSSSAYLIRSMAIEVVSQVMRALDLEENISKQRKVNFGATLEDIRCGLHALHESIDEARLVYSNDWFKRLMVALDPMSSEHLKRLLTHDDDPDVGAAARLSISQSTSRV